MGIFNRLVEQMMDKIKKGDLKYEVNQREGKVLDLSPAKTVEGITFKVANVELETEPFPMISYRRTIEEYLGSPIESCPPLAKDLVKTDHHPFAYAVMLAFQSHRPLILTPDHVWLLICQGFAAHINNNSEKLRSKFVKHLGKKKLVVRRDDLVKGQFDNPWPEVFPQFSQLIETEIGKQNHELFIAEFSTTGAVEKAAFEIVLMDGMKKYFSYVVETRCGIPSVTLQGTIDDWRLILERTKRLSEFDLNWWLEELLPVLTKFVEAFEGKIDKNFWMSIYRANSMSGSKDLLSGWFLKFFPYLTNPNSQPGTMYKNPYFNEKEDEFKHDPVAIFQKQFGLSGVNDDQLPSGISTVDFLWDYLGVEFDMEFIAGFIGVSQDEKTLAVSPEIGWAVREKR